MKLPYLRALVGAVRANMQNGRAGACTTYYSAFDPEVETLMRLKNPMTPLDKQIRGMDYAQIDNKFLARKAARNEDIFLFNIHTAPDLHAAFYSADLQHFEALYTKYEQDPNFKKTYVSAREIVLTSLNEAYETGRAYRASIDEINRHTPFKDTIYSSNLCVEICEPTAPYSDMRDLYTDGSVGYIMLSDTAGKTYEFSAVDPLVLENGRKIAACELRSGDIFVVEANGGTATVNQILEYKLEPEVALCSLAGLVVANIKNDEEYANAMYYALLMIDKCIHKSDYVLPHIGYTAKNRMSAAVGMMDLAHYLAKRHLSYTSPEGKAEIHRVAERHMYFAIEASLRLGQELGNAAWMHRTKWVDGWMPIDTYNKNVDSITAQKNERDWEGLRRRVVENGGIRNSTLVAYMPGESSSKASGTTNSLYPVRDTTLMKSDDNLSVYWAAPHSDKLAKHYELAWDIPSRDLIECYALFQKFTDQSISADLFRRIEGSEKITTDEMLGDYFLMHKYGLKTRYYQNTKTSKGVVLDEPGTAQVPSGEEAVASVKIPEALARTAIAEEEEDERGCAGGSCTL